MTHPVEPGQPQNPYGYGGPGDPNTQADPPQSAYPPGQPAQPFPPQQQAPYQPGPPQQQPYQAGPPQQQPYQAGPPQQQPYQAGPPHQQPYQAGPPQQQPYQAEPPQQQPYQAAPQPPHQPQPASHPPQFAPGQQPYTPHQSPYGHEPPHTQQQAPYAPQQRSFAPQQHPQQAPQQAPQLSYEQQQYPPAPPYAGGPATGPDTGPPAGPDTASATGTAQVHRGADSSSVTTLLLNVPLFLGSLLVIWLISQALPSGLDIVFIIAWLASGALVFHRPTERWLARLWFKMRPPTGAELAAIQPIWNDITRRAGIDGTKYELWLEDTDELNASAAAGHIVSVTRGAMRLPPEHLTAVMAHELGHHVGGHAWSGLLGLWYAMPVRAFMFVVKIVTTFLFFFTAELSCLVAGVFVMVFGGLAIATFLAFPPAVALYAIPFLLAWAGRKGELRADRFAGTLGYGPMLITVFTGWQAEGHDDARRKQSAIARLMSTHPPLHERIRALETFVS